MDDLVAAIETISRNDDVDEFLQLLNLPTKSAWRVHRVNDVDRDVSESLYFFVQPFLAPFKFVLQLR